MADEKQDRKQDRERVDRNHEERADRNHERSEEAHWQVAQAGAEEERVCLEEERAAEDARHSQRQEEDWENEGGAFDREPKKATE